MPFKQKMNSTKLHKIYFQIIFNKIQSLTFILAKTTFAATPTATEILTIYNLS